MEDPKVRSATPSDLEKLSELRISLQRHAESSNPRIWRITQEGRSRLKQELRQMLTDEDGQMLVAVEGGDLVGFAHGRVSHRTDYSPKIVGYISMIYVREKVRRQGVGSRLVAELSRFFRSENVEDVTLRYIRGNTEAEGFWRSLGFEPIFLTANTHLEKLEELLRSDPD